MRPIYTKSGEDIIRQVEDKMKTEVESKVKAEVESRIKAEVDKRVIDILREREERDKVEKAAKLAAAVDKAKSIKGDIEKEKADKEKADKEKADKEKVDKEKTEKENVDKDKESDRFDNILCPTCGKGHVHKIEGDKTGLAWKCTGDKCDLEYVMVPKKADYKCTNCNMPINKPGDENKMKDMSCPFCHGTKAIKFDWNKLWKVTGK